MQFKNKYYITCSIFLLVGNNIPDQSVITISESQSGSVLNKAKELAASFNIFNSSSKDLQNHSREVIIIGQPPNKHKLDDPEVQDVLLDFQKLDFAKNPCSDSLDVINYNEGKEANPFDKIAKHYGRNKDVFLFIAILRDTEQSKKIIDIIGRKCDVKSKEKFIERMNTYLERVGKGEVDAKEFLSSDNFPGAFFNGYHVACEGHKHNIHENLNINITKPEQSLEVSRLFNSTTKRIEEEKSELKRIKIYNNGKRAVTIDKNEKQQRNYSFTQHTSCEMAISWVAKDESGKNLSCNVVLNINSSEISVKESTIDGKNAKPREILELAKQNEALFIQNKALHEVLEEYFARQLSCEEKQNTQSNENILLSSFIDDEITIEEAFLQAKGNMRS